MTESPVYFTHHACDRYAERIKPLLDRGGARRELQQLVELAPTPTGKPPSWAPRALDRRNSTRFIAIADGICLACVETTTHYKPSLLAVTVLFRGGMQDKDRAERRAAGQEKRRRARMGRLAEKGARNRRKAA